MRRPMINNQSQKGTNLKVSPLINNRTIVELSGMQLEKRLRQKRSVDFVSSIKKLDAGGVTSKQAQIDELKQAIEKEFPELNPHQFPIGIIAKCYLGTPFEVHTLDLKLDIIEHYKKGEALPETMDRGRSVVLHPSYEFVEIYNDSIRAVTLNGDVSVIKG